MTQQSKVRTFIATIPDQALAQSLICLGESVKEQVSDKGLRWINPDNLHLTLRFLGDLDNEQLKDLPAILTEKLVGYKAFNIIFDQVRWFPSTKHPRAIAAYFKVNPELHAIALRAELAARAIGLHPEKRPFRAHLSLARSKIKRPAKHDLQHPIRGLSMPVNQVVIFKSDLSSNTPVYTALNKIPLS